ncbi:MAG: hypothetical protein LBO09_06215 [Candidatus Peribacteria bacterium]|jgi:hypothetical protein|nr:hypothetical protein [Candidatus Peribacteria bacterium]
MGTENEQNFRTLLKNDLEMGVIVARMQVGELTAGHESTTRTIQQRHKRLLIILGQTKDAEINSKNLYTFDFRRQMLQKLLREHDHIVVVEDVPGDDLAWTKEIDATIKRHLFPGETAVLYGSRDSFIPFYEKSKGIYPTQALAAEENDSGTAWRDRASVEPPKYSVETAKALAWYFRVASRQFEEKSEEKIKKALQEFSDKHKLELEKQNREIERLKEQIKGSQPLHGSKKNRGKTSKKN